MTALQLDRLHSTNLQLAGIIAQRDECLPLRRLYKITVGVDGVVAVQPEKKDANGIYYVASLGEYKRMKEKNYVALKHILINTSVPGVQVVQI
jgi:hypothetical protein